ncbi:integrase core domain-containing protein [Planctomicrobium sp. SH661]|uniref:integrase core domain-containing protein n=1 Tax=Planctomicrobium sp. SH661 TaxID=3448124 RepID=UPI003F5C4BFC
MYVFVWLCVSTREVIVSEFTEHPTSAWVCEQTRKFVDDTAGRAHKPDIVMHDRDTKFSREFTDTLKANVLRTNRLPKTSLNLNGRCEKFVGTIKSECLSKFIIFGKRHLDHLITEFSDYYNRHRSHMCRGHLPPVREEPEDVEKLRLDEIEVKSFAGGLVKGFERKAG